MYLEDIWNIAIWDFKGQQKEEKEEEEEEEEKSLSISLRPFGRRRLKKLEQLGFFARFFEKFFSTNEVYFSWNEWKKNRKFKKLELLPEPLAHQLDSSQLG